MDPGDTDTESFVTAGLSDVPAAQVPSSPIALEEVTPDHGPISGGEKVTLTGYGFSGDQRLLVRFGHSAKHVKTEWVNQHNLRCILPPSDSAGCVLVTLHWKGRSDVIPNEDGVIFEYEDVDKELSVPFG
jgi:hypothetical protein